MQSKYNKKRETMKPERIFICLLISLSLLTTACQAQNPRAPITLPTTTQGTLNGAGYHITIPKNWHGGLILYAHGYVFRDQASTVKTAFANMLGELGYAVAQSQFSRQGWAVEEGMQDTEALRAYFEATYGETYPTLIIGHSQGAAITLGLIEQLPQSFDGALPMCFSGHSSLTYLQNRGFNTRVLFDLYFPGLSGSAVDFPHGKNTYEKLKSEAEQLLKGKDEAAAQLADLLNLSSAEHIPWVVAFWSELLRELNLRSGGNPFDNRNTLYTGSDNDAELNHRVARYAAVPEAAAYLRRWVRLTGDIRKPVLALHTLTDELSTPHEANQYQIKVAEAGKQARYVLQMVNRHQHCDFTVAETKTAVRQLTDWVKTGLRPQPGDVTQGEDKILELLPQ